MKRRGIDYFSVSYLTGLEDRIFALIGQILLHDVLWRHTDPTAVSKVEYNSCRFPCDVCIICYRWVVTCMLHNRRKILIFYIAVSIYHVTSSFRRYMLMKKKMLMKIQAPLVNSIIQYSLLEKVLRAQRASTLIY